MVKMPIGFQYQVVGRGDAVHVEAQSFFSAHQVNLPGIHATDGRNVKGHVRFFSLPVQRL